MSITATQQVKEKRGARAHAHEARAEPRGKIAQEQHLWHSPFKNERGGGVQSTLLYLGIVLHSQVDLL